MSTKASVSIDPSTFTANYYFLFSSIIFHLHLLAENEAEARKKGGVAYVRKASKLVLYMEVQYILPT